MVNSDKALFFLKNPTFPASSIVRLIVTHKLITESLDRKELISDCLIEKIKNISIGKLVRNKIEDIVNFDSRESIVDFFSKKIKLEEIAELDVYTNVAIVSLPLEIYFGNREQITEEIISETKKITFKTFFTEVTLD